MTERPILFSGAMVRALLAGTKTQTRRAVKPQPREHHWHGLPGYLHQMPFHAVDGGGAARSIHSWQPANGRDRAFDLGEWLTCPYGAPGDRLWVRETHALLQPTTDEATAREHRDRIVCRPEDGERVAVWYRADGEMPLAEQLWADDPDDGIRWRPSIHMPRWASRLTLEVTGVRVERLCDISEEDAKAEGIEQVGTIHNGSTPTWRDYRDQSDRDEPNEWVSPRNSFMTLWESINGEGSWAANPWVWVVEFKRVTP